MISGSQDKLRLIKEAQVTESHDPKVKKPPVNFFKCNIPVGAELVYMDDPRVRAVVVSERKVQYNDEITSLSAIAAAIKGYPVAGPSCFTYNGKLVAEIARETQWKDF